MPAFALNIDTVHKLCRALADAEKWKMENVKEQP